MDRPAVSIDLGGSHATLAIVAGERLLTSRELDLDASKPLRPMLEQFAEAVRAMLREMKLDISECSGIALGFCGLADARTGRVVSTNEKYEDAPAIDFPAWARDALGLRFAIENDARMALLGERHAGAARGYDNVVMITLGTGIGGAAMLEGKLLRGKHAQAGCLGGHLPGRIGGRRCSCGNVGCLESEGSGWALPLVAQDWPGFQESALAKQEAINFQSLFALSDRGDRVASEVLEYCMQVWAAAAVGLIHAYDPEIVVFGGGVMRRASTIVPFIQRHVDEHAWTPWGNVRVVAAKLGNNAGLFGASPLLAGNV